VSPTTTTTTTTKQNLDPRCTYVHAGKNHTFLNSCVIWEAVELKMVFYKH
jgi:hypothetical protein